MKIYIVHFDSEDSFVYNGEKFFALSSHGIDKILNQAKETIKNTKYILDELKYCGYDSAEDYFKSGHFENTYRIYEKELFD